MSRDPGSETPRRWRELQFPVGSRASRGPCGPQSPHLCNGAAPFRRARGTRRPIALLLPPAQPPGRRSHVLPGRADPASPGPRRHSRAGTKKGRWRRHGSPPAPGRPGAAHLRRAGDGLAAGRGEVRNRNCARGGRGRAPSARAPSREEMSQARPVSRNLFFLYTFLQNHGPGSLHEQVVGVPGVTVTDVLEFDPEISPDRDSLHELAAQLASTADDMELRFVLCQFAELPWMVIYSLFFTYNQTGLRDVYRSFMYAVTNLRENRRFRNFLAGRGRVFPGPWREMVLSLLLGVLLSCGCRLAH
nr:bcl-2-interacting killer [Camelus dromedarius]